VNRAVDFLLLLVVPLGVAHVEAILAGRREVSKWDIFIAYIAEFIVVLFLYYALGLAPGP
jgi:hypothetical protein